MSSRPQLSEEHLQLAAEHALGLLSGEDLRRARGLQAEDSQFREEVGRWHGRLAPLLDEVRPVEAPARVWAAIEQRIGDSEGQVETTNVVALRRRVTIWRAATAAATALAASLALVSLLRPDPVLPPPVEVRAAPPLVAMLPMEEGPPLLASWHPDDRRLTVTASADMPDQPGQSHELWLIPADGQPRSLGVMQAAPKAAMNVSPVMAGQLQQGTTLAVSVEPEGGSPTGLPTGPVIASGKLEPV